MLERGKSCSSATIATALAVSGGNPTERDTRKLSSHSTNEPCTCNSENFYALPRINLQEIECIEVDPIETDATRYANGSCSSATIVKTRNNTKICCRTSTSSGYSSHSPPLSAASYSCYTSTVSRQNFLRNAPSSMKDQLLGGLAIIHESKTIPRPIWPTVFPKSNEIYQNDDNTEYDSLYAYCGCGCTYTYSYCDLDHEKSVSTSAHEVLLELSRTLNSVLEGKNPMTPEEALYNISHRVSQTIGLTAIVMPSTKNTLNEENSGLLDSGKNNTSSSSVNTTNAKMYNNARHFYLYSPTWYNCLCDGNHKTLSSMRNYESMRKEKPPTVLLIENHCQKTATDSILQNRKDVMESTIYTSVNRSTSCYKNIKNVYESSRITCHIGETSAVNDGSKQNRKNVISDELEYRMKLERDDDGSRKKEIKNNQWDYRMRGFNRDLDFTLDVSRAERLGRAIAKAKRNRQWCRVLTTILGLVFFVLSVIVVSMSVTKGRKVFGSM